MALAESDDIGGAAADVEAFGELAWHVYARCAPREPGAAGGTRTAALGAFPPSAPFSLAFLTAACLTREPSARPSVGEVLEALSALRVEAAAGVFTGLDGASLVRCWLLDALRAESRRARPSTVSTAHVVSSAAAADRFVVREPDVQHGPERDALSKRGMPPARFGACSPTARTPHPPPPLRPIQCSYSSLCTSSCRQALPVVTQAVADVAARPDRRAWLTAEHILSLAPA